MDKLDIKAIARNLFPSRTELDAYNELGGKIGLGPLNDKEYEEFKKTGRRPCPVEPETNPFSNENKTMNKKATKLRETSGYDELKTRAIDRFRLQDPMTLSNSELRSAIDYMLAYRWALEGDEDVLHEYIEASKIRNEDRHPSQNESRRMNKKVIRLTESDLHRIVKESVNRLLREDSYRKTAKKGIHYSPSLKQELRYQEQQYKNGDGKFNPKDFYKYTKRHGIKNSSLNSYCDYEDESDRLRADKSDKKPNE